MVFPQDALDRVVAGNRTYAKKTAERDPEFFKTLATGQSPEILWIGCADSRVPETTICDCQPGDIFVHRNIANCLHAQDLNASSVIEYATTHLKVKKIVVCGHTMCGGANAALGDADLGEALNTWLLPIRELRRKNKAVLDKLPSDDARGNKLAELNVQQSLEVLRQIPTVSKAIRDRGLSLHGLIYDIAAGELVALEETKKGNGLWSASA
ncbi:carbonic anhydrase [Lophium mytilinum]|uniref:Carbonic anhydrase n=1 Tax=Lophium mytilinum TaxID=390894 RepID=A0A6A6QLY6_9PEZI|nr:carbonic anhydrase [Lophium mytilinum]